MSSLPALDTISNGTTADASEVDGNFTVIKDYINGELIERDGTTAMTGELTLSSSTPSGDLVAASRGYVRGLLADTGGIYSGSVASVLSGGKTVSNWTADTDLGNAPGVSAATFSLDPGAWVFRLLITKNPSGDWGADAGDWVAYQLDDGTPKIIALPTPKIDMPSVDHGEVTWMIHALTSTDVEIILAGAGDSFDVDLTIYKIPST